MRTAFMLWLFILTVSMHSSVLKARAEEPEKPERVSESTAGAIKTVNEDAMLKDENKYGVMRVGNMVKIPGGTFYMGSNSGIGYTTEGPYHPVYLDDFWMDMYEVTVAEFVEFLNTGEFGSYYNPLMADDKVCGIIRRGNGFYDAVPGRENYPVTYVSWEGASAYARWAGKRLPTEAEWEKAARGGVLGRQYSTAGYCAHKTVNYKGRSGRDRWDFTSPVGVFPPNEYMMFDMCGNTWEWIQDYFHPNFYAADTMYNPVNDPPPPHPFRHRMIRGGSWADDNEKDSYLRVSARGPNYPIPENWGNRVGFRCASDNPPKERQQRTTLDLMIQKLRNSNPGKYGKLPEDSLRVILIEQEFEGTTEYESNIKSMGWAVTLSALIPGGGQLYTGRYFTAAAFAGVEIGAWVAAFVNHSKARDIDVFFRAYANEHFSVGRYETWLSDYQKLYGRYPDTYESLVLPVYKITTNVTETYYDANGIRRTRTIQVVTSQRSKSDDYYILISKYNQFMPGWDDFVAYPAQGGKGISQNRDYYTEIKAFRQKQYNDYTKKKNIYIMAIAANHLLSVVDTIWGLKRNTIYRSEGWTWDMTNEHFDREFRHLLNLRYKW